MARGPGRYRDQIDLPNQQELERRLLILCEYSTLNGGERSLLSVLPQVRQDGWDVRVAAPQRGPLAEALRELNVPRVDWDLRGESAHRPPLAEARERLSDLCRRVAPRLIHSNSLSMARLAGPLAEQSGIPSIGHLRDILRLSQAAVNDLNRNRLLLAVSRATRDWHVRQGVAADRVRVVHNGVDLERFRPAEPTGWLHRELGVADETCWIGAIGQLGMRKGLDVWLDAAARIAAREPRARFVIVGTRLSEKPEAVEWEGQLRRRAESGILRGRCFFLGVRDDVPRLLPELSVLMHAARQEPLGRVLLEAAACGVPVVATQAGGTAEIFDQTARLVPVDDAEGLAGAALELLQHPPLARQLAAAARRRMEQHFLHTTAAARLLDAYRSALAAP